MSTSSSRELTPLQTKVAREIVALVRREGRRAGEHLPEVHLSEQIGTSRSPVQAALRHLSKLGVLQQDLNRGYFLVQDAKAWDAVAARFSSQPDDPLYLAIAEERQAGKLSDEVTEAELMRRFNVARSTLRKVLARISEEGWIEQRVGHGWCFSSMIDSPEAYEESYLFRQAVEPTGLLGPSFRFDAGQLRELRREQQLIVDGGFKTMTAIELFEANSRFHETLAQWSNNRFVLQSVKRINQLRRLVEYRQASKRGARQTQAQEHLGILDAINQHEFLQAASLMRAHLDGARRGKVHGKDVFTR
ncbi:GntR family transcriptional regulator [Polaromonas sp. JS666]|uniref:GntR family transcriptional regulator n=1 Tax=Polaromonas sp. (strain JS666 / ATCC BAA-500) TaxID=296591 RepID=UPI0009F293BA|nr:GntR family transcriptional regulator [Polaromonas sp. JS666]